MFLKCELKGSEAGRTNGHELARISHRVSSRETVQTGMDTRRATKGPAGILDSMLRSPTERNAADMPGSTAAAEGR